MKTILASVAALFLMTSAGCEPASDGDAVDAELSVDSKADTAGRNFADRSCRVVLRTVTNDNVQNAEGWFQFTATVDVTTGLGDVIPGMLWRTNTSTRWQNDAVPVEIEGAQAGFQRFELKLTHDTFSGGDGEATESLQISMIPNIKPGSDSYFDHNRVHDGNYVLWSGDTAGGLVKAPVSPKIGAGFQVKNDPRICP